MKRILVFLAVALFVALFLVLVGRKKTEPSSQPSGTEISENEQPTLATATPPITASQSREPGNEVSQQKRDPQLEARGAGAIAEQAERNAETEKKWKEQWETPIEFYGKVIDESQAPIPGAVIQFERTNQRGEGLQSSTTSDQAGLFSLAGVKSRDLAVHVSKDGYYPSKTNQTYFLYADITGRGTFTPGRSNPVTFQLRKKGSGTDLITSQNGVKGYFGVTMPLDGTPVQVDLLSRKVGQGQLQLTQIKPEHSDWRLATNWMFRMEIPDGGFIEHNDEFAFEAPENGYQPVVQLNFQQGQTDWTNELKKSYYVKFGTPPKYGSLQLDTSIMMAGARLTYAINPDGLRYLESKN